jgi:SNF2 family DNA or RNA helicase
LPKQACVSRISNLCCAAAVPGHPPATVATSAAHLKAAAAAAAATGSSDPAPTSLTLHPYQREGVRWLLNKLARGQSAILGDQMGLGKTIQTAAFCDGARLLGLLSGPVLIAAPKSTVPNWTNELRTWCPTLDCVTYVGGKASREALKKVDFPFPSGPTREAHSWRRSGGGSFTDVVLTNYEVVMADASAFRTVRWGAVIVDEGHRLKNQNSALTQTLLSLRCPWRCLLTGTPLQNNLEELFALLHFLDPRRFARPDRLAAAFTARDDDDDLHDDDDDDDGETRVETLSAELKNLHALLEKHMLRRLKRDVLRGLPKKRAVEVSVPLTPFQREVYADVLARNHVALNSTVNATQRTTLNNTLKELQKVCNHPFLYPAAEQDAFKAARKSGLAGKLARDATRERRVYREKVARDNETARLGAQLLPAPDVGGVGKPQHAYPVDLPDAVWIDNTRVTPPMLPLEPLPATLLRTSSGKMQLLAKLLPALRARGHRVLLFCQMTRMLDIIDDWLRASGVGMERDPMDPSGMRGRRVYSRVDGATPSTTRQRVIESFNSEESVTFLMLVSTRAGGLGLNLATADTVIMYDPDFNPFVDEQAQSRAHRMGQRKEVVVYQLVTAATVEERIVELAKSKRAVERLVVKRGRDESDVPDESVESAEIGDESRRLTKHGSVSRAAELAKVLMHGARKIVTRAAATSAEAAKSAAFLEKKVNAKCEFKDSEIERLLDRENLPVEADGEDGDGYLGGVGDGRVHLENDEDEDDAVGRTTDPEEDDETRAAATTPRTWRISSSSLFSRSAPRDWSPRSASFSVGASASGGRFFPRTSFRVRARSEGKTNALRRKAIERPSPTRTT